MFHPLRLPNRARAAGARQAHVHRLPLQAWLGSAALLVLLGFALSPLGALATTDAATEATPATVVTPGGTKPLPLQFVPNVGQWSHSELLYLTRAADLDALFKRDHVELRLRDAEAPATLRLRPLAAEATEPQPGAKRVTVVNDYRGQDPARWHRGIPTYEDLRYVDLYPEIDLVFRTHEQRLAYDFIVHPGANPASIRVALEGARELSVESDGSLRATLPDGRAFRQQPPFIYQERDGEREPVSGRFQVLASRAGEDAAPVYGFAVDDYDPSRALIIDPTLDYSSLVGSDGEEAINAMYVTSAEEAIVAGWTDSTDFATNAGATEIGPTDEGESTLGGDIGFIYQMAADGSSLDFVTLLGGSDDDVIRDLAVSGGNIYVAGSTDSEDFPLVNPLFRVLTDGTNAFVTKLSAAGALVAEGANGFSTYYGGNGDTSANAVAVDNDGSIYIAGVTDAPDLVLRNPLYSRLAGGDDGFIVQFAPNGTSLDYATYYGGSDDDSIEKLIVSNSLDTVSRPLVSDTGDLFLAGHTESSATDRDGTSDFPVKHALQPALGDGQDVFLARIARGGQELVFSTYIGGSDDDVLTDFALDAEGNYLLSGYTTSEDWPTENAIIPNYPFDPDGDEMGTLVKIDKSGRFRHFATYLGAAGDDRALAVAAGTNAAGEDVVYVAGTTDSNAFPIQNAFQGYHAGEGDGFLAILDGSGQTMRFSSYFGGSEADQIVAIRPSNPTSDTSVIFSGMTDEEDSALFPIESPVQAEHAGDIDTFVARFDTIELGPRLPVLRLGSADDSADPLDPDNNNFSSIGDADAAKIYLSDTIYPPSVIDGVGFVLRLDDRTNPGDPGVIAFSTKLYFDTSVLASPNLEWADTTVLNQANKTPGGPLTCTDGVCDIFVFQPAGTGTLPGGRPRLDSDDSQLAIISFDFVDGEADIDSQEVVVGLQEVATAVVEGDLDDVISGLPGTRFVERRCNDILGDCDCSGRVQLFEVQSAVTYALNPAPLPFDLDTDPGPGDPSTAGPALDGTTDSRPICIKTNYVGMSVSDLSANPMEGIDADQSIIANYLAGTEEEEPDTGGEDEAGGEDSVSESMGMGTLSASSESGVNPDTSTSERLDFVSPQISGSTVSYDLKLSASDEPSGLFIDIFYDPAHVEDPSAITGAALSSVGKQVVYNVVEPGWLRLVAYGINLTTIPDGILATVELELAPGSTIDDLMLEMKAAAAIPSLGRDINLHSNGVEGGHFVIQMESSDSARH
ncbi:SBBP repeat-containing protein [Halochromatium salexigens]|uniref:DUF7948 domain-containing protein n=1 Tax=Halochromatium salexigens TaxID=49447 RepID=A0AAJ0UI61_HALSE|nr:SBBP repeat-containing protein [Halochromatium salexigens]MBK5931776.1 hypothetical protein [Halochromatium salexigens]